MDRSNHKDSTEEINCLYKDMFVITWHSIAVIQLHVLAPLDLCFDIHTNIWYWVWLNFEIPGNGTITTIGSTLSNDDEEIGSIKYTI